MKRVDLNADCGESFGPWTMGDDEAIFDIVTSANVACGGHAGDPHTMARTLELAKAKGVSVGAHPGYEDKAGFGRRIIPMKPDEIERMIAYQVGAMLGMAAYCGVPVRYVKAHGAVSNHAMRDRPTADAIARAVKAVDPSLTLLAVARTHLQHAAEEIGLNAAMEIFADRTYRPDATLTPRSEPNAVLHDADDAAARVIRMLEKQAIVAEDGTEVPTAIHSICVHGDEPTAVDTARRVRQRLEEAGFTLQAFSA